MSTENKPTVYMSERHINPEMLAAMQKHENFTWAGVLAILSTILFIVLLALQWVDWSKLSVA
jgi:hypothetical protein